MTYSKNIIDSSISINLSENSAVEESLHENAIINETIDNKPDAPYFMYPIVRALVDLEDLKEPNPIDIQLDEEISALNIRIREELQAILAALDHRNDLETVSMEISTDEETLEVDTLVTDEAMWLDSPNNSTDFDHSEPDTDCNDILTLFNDLTDEEKAILFSRVSLNAGQDEYLDVLRGLTRTPAVEINPKNIDEENTRKLLQFFDFQAQLDIKLWKKNRIYTFMDGTNFTLKNDVFQRERKEGHEGVRYEVISNKAPLGEGGFGKVIDIKGTLALDHEEEEIRFKKYGKNNQRRVVKIQAHNELTNSSSELQKRFEFSKRATHLAIKKPTLIDTNLLSETSYITMAKIAGRELFDIIAEDENGTRILSTDERIELTNALLKALKEQVSDSGLIHRDIKPENIIVDLNIPIVANIIDYDESTDTPDGNVVATPGYYAPEITSAPMTTSAKSDVYSMARVIALIWRVDFETYAEPYNPEDYFPEDMLVGIFTDINDLREEEKQCIETLLLGMLENEPNTRLSIDEAIDIFSFFNQEEIIDEMAPNLLAMDEFTPDVDSEVGDKKEACKRFISMLENLSIKLAELRAKAQDNKHYIPASEKGWELFNSLVLSGIEYFETETLTSEQFNQQCADAISKARPELEKHRGFSELFADIVFFTISLCTLGAANMVSKLTTGSYRFFSPKKTDAVEQLDRLELAGELLCF